MGSPKPKAPSENLLQQCTWPEEDRHLFTSAPWDGGYRWFRSSNVVPLEQYRMLSAMTKKGDEFSHL
jgi:hypothetical protein